ncbi:MAG: Fic family protein [Reyranella sp.]|nr:Fic family protein [Reyranella sp.]
MRRDDKDPYLYPDSDVLRNKPGLRAADALAGYEYEHTALRLSEMRRWPPPGRFDLEELKRIHRHIFQDMYDWAGSIRSVDIARAGQMFCRPGFIASEGKRLTDALAGEKLLRGLSQAAFIDRLAEHYGDWNALHPFRDGNGRSTREFFRRLAKQAGYEFDLTKIERGTWNEASASSFKGDTKPLRDVLATAVRPFRSA